jgi:hypothetical protein
VAGSASITKVLAAVIEVDEEIAGLGQQEFADEDRGAFDGCLKDEITIGVIEQVQDEGPACVCAAEFGAGALRPESPAIIGDGGVIAAPP